MGLFEIKVCEAHDAQTGPFLWEPGETISRTDSFHNKDNTMTSRERRGVLLNTSSSSLSSSSLSSSSSSSSSSTLQPTMFSSSGIPSHVQDLKLKKLFDLKNTKRSWLPPVSLDTISAAEKRTLDQSKKPPQK